VPACARREIVKNGVVAVYHTWSRCVQSTYLMGVDPHTGVDYADRRQLFEDLIRYQAGVFSIDVGNYAILSNHAHLILRTRPDLTVGWSDEEVALRWKLAWPEWNEGRWQREVVDKDLEATLNDPERLASARASLSNLSWFMARIKEPIARLANQLAGTKGHFWESRFGSRELVDVGDLLTCMAYVDLNQLKAGMIHSMADSQSSGIAHRMAQLRSEQAEASVLKFAKRSTNFHEFTTEQAEELLAGSHLSPIGIDGPLRTTEMLAADQKAREREARQVIRLAESDPSNEVTPSESEPLEVEVEAIAEATETSPIDCTPTDADPRWRLLSADLSAGRDPQAVCESSASTASTSAVFDTEDTKRILSEVFPQGLPLRNSNLPFVAMPLEEYVRRIEWAADHYLKVERPAELARATEFHAAEFHAAAGCANRSAQVNREATIYSNARHPGTSMSLEVLEQLLQSCREGPDPPGG